MMVKQTDISSDGVKIEETKKVSITVISGLRVNSKLKLNQKLHQLHRFIMQSLNVTLVIKL